MNEQWAPLVFLCLATGAGMGALFLACKVLRVLFGLGKWSTAILDVFFCLVCTLVVFLCALAIDKGRLRFYQAGLQGIGGICLVLVLDPFVSGIAGGIHRVFLRLFARGKRILSRFKGFFVRFCGKRGKKIKKRRKKGAKPQKKT